MLKENIYRKKNNSYMHNSNMNKFQSFAIGLMSKVFANGPGDRGSITSWVIPKTQKRYLSPPCLTLSIIKYGSRVKWSSQENGVAPSSTPRCSSYWKRSLWVTKFTLFMNFYVFKKIKQYFSLSHNSEVRFPRSILH